MPNGCKIKCRFCKQEVPQYWDRNGDRWRVAEHCCGETEIPIPCRGSDNTVTPGGGQVEE